MTLLSLLDDLGIKNRLAVAVSGGADSFALLHMAHAWAQKNRITLHAFTVDHGLRAESATEAQTVAHWCKTHHIAHETLLWTGDKPTSGLQDAARNARRHLLIAACKQHKILHVLMGHHADDQAETVIMRLQRGSGLRGLLGMDPVTEEDGIQIVRPLLEVRRTALRAYARQHDLPFHDDPSNDDPHFERTRVRQALSALPDLADGVTKTIARLADIQDTITHLGTEWFNENHEALDDAQIWLHHDLVNVVFPPIQLFILEATLTELGAETIPLDGLERLREAMTAPDFKGQTLAGLHISRFVLDDEPGFLFKPAPARQSGTKKPY